MGNGFKVLKKITLVLKLHILYLFVSLISSQFNYGTKVYFFFVLGLREERERVIVRFQW